MTVTRRRVVGAVAGLPLLTRAARAQDVWPSRPVTIVSPLAPGGAGDVIARPLAQHLTTELGQPFVVEARAGAGGTIAHASVARSRPDGYTLLISTNSTYAIARHLYPLTYDPEASFTPIALLVRVPQVVCVPVSVPARTLTEFMALVRAAPRDAYTYASAGIGFSSHVATEMFLSMTGLSMLHVPYRGGAGSAQALLQNEVHLSFADMPSAVALLQAGAVRALAVSTRQRSPVMPDVPTMDEAGVPGFESSTDYGLVAPAGTPAPILARLRDASFAFLRTPARRAALETAGFLVTPVSGDEFRRLQLEDAAKWGRIIQERGIRAQ